MKIGLDVSQMVYSGHGVGRYAVELCRSLLMLDTPHNFVFYAGAYRNKTFLRMRSRNKPWSRAKWVIKTIPPRVARILWNYTTLPINIFTGNIDIFHTSDWTEPRTTCPSVTTVHDLVFRKYPETVDRLVHKTEVVRMERVIKYSDHIIVDSVSTKNDLMKEYGINESRITVVYPGIDSRFEPKKIDDIDRVKNKYQIEGNYILALGTREPRKNLKRVVDAFKSMKQKNLKLVIVGRHGWGPEDFSGVQDVIFTDFIPDQDLPALYSGAETFVYPSLYEGFGFPVLESMACGTPVVTSNTSSLPEVAGDAAILVNPKSVKAIREGILESIKKKKTLTKKGLQQAANFTWAKTARETIAVYEKVVQVQLNKE